MSPLRILAKITRRRPHIRLNARANFPWLTIVGANGEVILHSETYSSLGAARRSAIALSVDTGWAIKDVKA
jgi:uncharacterized protein YegP (UPF0339 family)